MSAPLNPTETYPLLIRFAPGSRVLRESPYTPKLHIVQNGQPGTFVRFTNGTLIPLPTDQIVFATNGDGGAEVAFGGMKEADMEDDQLVFYRVRDLLPADQLSPQRGVRMTLEPWMVIQVISYGRVVWPH